MFRRIIVNGTRSLRQPNQNNYIPKEVRRILHTQPKAILLSPHVSQSSSGSSYLALKQGVTAMAFLAALTSQFTDIEGSKNTQCLDLGACNFIADAAAIASPAVVNVVVNLSAGGLGLVGQASGSGFIIDSSGLVATNAHVVANALHRGSSLTVTLNDGRKFTAKVHSLDRQLDIALIQLDLPDNNTQLPYAQIGHSGEMRAGEWVVALGSPLRLQNTVTAGILSSIARGASEIGFGDQNYEYLQTDAAINQGNSGGPLVNLRGEVIGINTAKLGGNLVSGISFAIPMDVAWQVIQQLRTYGNVRRPYLGIKFVNSSKSFGRRSSRLLMPQLGEEASTSDQRVQIAEVISGSPAEQAGLREGDVIIEFDRRKVTKMRDIIERLGYEYGRSIELKVRRDGQELSVDVVSSKPKGYGR